MRKPRHDQTHQSAASPHLKEGAPIAIGTGLVALDVVVTDREGVAPRIWAGGTCGNVLAILAYLGWRTYPAATLGDDAAADHIFADLKTWNVDTRYLRRSSSRHTPVVVERIRTRNLTKPRHRWVWTCPACGAWLPGYQAVLSRDAREMATTLPVPSVFFFDRLSRGALDLAAASARAGALIAFEPSGIRDEGLFREAIALSDVVKYSHQRLGSLPDLTRHATKLVEIQTLGDEGLRYRVHGSGKRNDRWREMGAYAVQPLRDTAGAGDWCTAGLLHQLAKSGAKALTTATRNEIEEGLRFGQALAAIACRYEGARGSMYALSMHDLEAAVTQIMDGQLPECDEVDAVDTVLEDLLRTICPSCDGRQRESTESGTTDERHDRET
jgi:fructokinase